MLSFNHEIKQNDSSANLPIRMKIVLFFYKNSNDNHIKYLSRTIQYFFVPLDPYSTIFHRLNILLNEYCILEVFQYLRVVRNAPY